MTAMRIRERWQALEQVKAVRTALFVLGCLLIVASPALGVLPGPGGIIVFGAGLALTLKYSEWAKRQYVRFKRKQPKMAAWADWGMRRESARRREALEKARKAEAELNRARQCDDAEIERVERDDGRAILFLYGDEGGAFRYSIERCYAGEEPYGPPPLWAPVRECGGHESLESARRAGCRELELA